VCTYHILIETLREWNKELLREKPIFMRAVFRLYLYKIVQINIIVTIRVFDDDVALVDGQ
jgi:hypothetical protein